MGKQEIKLNKQVFGKVSYPKVIDTEFRQLVKPEEIEVIEEPITVAEFFLNMIDYFLKFLKKELVHTMN